MENYADLDPGRFPEASGVSFGWHFVVLNSYEITFFASQNHAFWPKLVIVLGMDPLKGNLLLKGGPHPSVVYYLGLVGPERSSHFNCLELE